MKKIRENAIILKIQKIKKEQGTHWLSYFELNAIKSKAAENVMKNKISLEFYKNVFNGGDISHHWSDVNIEYIMNYFN